MYITYTYIHNIYVYMYYDLAPVVGQPFGKNNLIHHFTLNMKQVHQIKMLIQTELSVI